MFVYTTVVYNGDERLGEVEVYPQEQEQVRYEDEENNRKREIINQLVMKDIRISHFSQPSERCPPLAVLHTVTSSGVCFKMESRSSLSQESPLQLLHSYCIRDNKTAVMLMGSQEIHFVAMYSRNNIKPYPCFWGFNVAPGLYESCVGLLNIRCLGIVFDLDETLIVANTMRSFEDRIDALQRKISNEVDLQRIAAMVAEVKRYQDDKSMLKQYLDNDQVVENGKVIKVQSEVVPVLSGNHQPIVRPLIRLQEKNVILTRINPLIRDTSVLVRLRPAWEDLRSYLIARGRKRFEVYVCTMAERDYALEMWRLLDPDLKLISSNELLDRVVCVKSGLRKSLFNVFQGGICHPKMALVIDDRLKVWDEKDQSRVHVVPAFAPYYAPQAEENNAIPVLCVARNVACNVRGGFFKEFDDSLLQRLQEISYEDDIIDIPSPPDVSNFLVSEDDACASIGNKAPLPSDGMADAEVERRLKEAISASLMVPQAVTNLDPRLTPPLQYMMPPSNSLPTGQLRHAAAVVKQMDPVGPLEPTLQNSPAREEGEVPESELDPDTRRRLLILQHGADIRDQPLPASSIPAGPQVQVSAPLAQSHGSWFPVNEDMSLGQMNRAGPLDSVSGPMEKHRSDPLPYFNKVENPIPSDRILHENQRVSKEPFNRADRLRANNTLSMYPSFSGEEMPYSHLSSRNRDTDFESGQARPSSEMASGVLQDIAMRCGAKVEFTFTIVASTELQFYVEARLAGQKIGEGVCRTRREAQCQAADNSIKNLAQIYMSRGKPDSGSVRGDASTVGSAHENGFLSTFGNHPFPRDGSEVFSASESSRLLDPRLETSKKAIGPISALKELCMMEGLQVAFQPHPLTSTGSFQNNEVHAQVEIDGQVFGKGIGLTWDEAKMQAAERALGSLRSMFSQKRHDSPRSLQGMPSKRPKPDFQRALHRVPSAGRYPKNAPLVP